MLNIFASIRRLDIGKFLIVTVLIYLTAGLCWIFMKSIGINLLFSACGTVNLTLTLRNGRIEGTYKKSYNGRYFLAFEGIPYAAPPVGKLRFKSPKPASKWKEVLYANKMYTCMQMKSAEAVIGEEDCLYLNVYVPKISPELKLPVIVNFHSGNFMNGNPNLLSGPTKFMDRNVVYVSVNYRLGVLGFFSSFDEVIPGNFGLKDQSYALKWIQKNIENFRGDKNLVTIIGMSAGGASVHYHYFSSLSRGLFHRGISQSGTAIDPWALKSNELRRSRRVYRNVGCIQRDMLSCMQKVPARNLINQTAKILQQYQHLPLAPLGPVVEAYHKNAFITIDPYYLLMTKEFYDVPYLITTTTEEGIIPCIDYLNHLDDLNKNWSKISSLLFEYYNLYNRKEMSAVAKNITKTFFQNQNVTQENFKFFIKIVSERLWDLGAEKSARSHALGGKSNVYLMRIGYGGENLHWEAIAKQKLKFGVGHLEDSKFYYDDVYHNLNESSRLHQFSEKENQMKDVLLDIITDFARYGKMKVQNWEPVNHKNGALEYLLIKGPRELFIKKEMNRTVADKFWGDVRKILEEHCYG